MYFFVDESGNSGLNLFDERQPALVYGLLSSSCDLDDALEPTFRNLRNRLGVERLHAAELGIGRIAQIAPDLITLVDRFQIKFDLYRLFKLDYAVIQFFDQVFDQGLNPAVGWLWYWTPLRYALLLPLAHLFDENLAKDAWSARIDRNDTTSDARLIQVCRTLLDRVDVLPDERCKQLIRDALTWAIDHPRHVEYNANRKDMQLAISPNLIGFQFVLTGIAERLRRAGRRARRIVVDQQQQFNRAQGSLADFYARGSGQVFPLGPGLPELDLRNMPTDALHFSSSRQAAGLELVDIIMWLFIRKHAGASFDPATERLIGALARGANYDELSLEAIEARWTPILLADRELTEEGFYPVSTDGLIKIWNSRSRRATLRRIRGLWNRSR